MRYRALALLVGMGLLVSGCATTSTGGVPETRPDDFQLEYHWREGSLPPPYHYEYDIVIGPGAQGEIVFRPDYASDETPVWREPLTLTEADLDTLYALATEKGLFSQTWREESDPPIGGSYDWVDATANGQQVSLPAFIEGDTQAMQALYETIRALVPQTTWDNLEAQRQQYMEDQE